MVDTLEDDWWVGSHDAIAEADGETEQDKSQKRTGIKRKSESQPDFLSPSSKPKKKQKRIKITDKLAKREDIPATLSDFNAWLDKCGKGTLSTVELEDLHLKETFMLDANTTKSGLSEYLSGVIPKWKSHLKTESNATKSCTLLVVSSSGKRAVDLNRDAAQFRGKCNTAKLFAKHIKLKDQVALLNKKKIDFAVGTPNRIASVINAGALDVSKTVFLILDWNWRDVKLRRLIDLPELEKDLFALLKDHFLPAMRRNGKMKMGLF